MKPFWFIPTHGDGRYLGTTTGGRTLDYAGEVMANEFVPAAQSAA